MNIQAFRSTSSSGAQRTPTSLRPLWLATALFAMLPLSEQLSAQTVSGVVMRANSGTRVAGAIVMAVAERGDTVPAVFSSSSGHFQIRLQPGRPHELIVRSIGLLPARIRIGLRAAGQDTTVTVVMSPVGITLPPVNVEGITRCDESTSGTAAVADIWSTVTTSLANSRLTRTLLPREYRWVLQEREVNAYSAADVFASADTSVHTTLLPFTTVPLQEILRSGYVVASFDSVLFRVPDESALEDTSFIESHCFWATSRETTLGPQVGLRFVPVSGLERNDIAGTFWLDAGSFELRALEFAFTQKVLNMTARSGRSRISYSAAAPFPEVLPIGVPEEMSRPGGELHFRRLDDGTVLIERWRLWVTDNWEQTVLDSEKPATPQFVRERRGQILRIGGG
jgi:hypothetical protein